MGIRQLSEPREKKGIGEEDWGKGTSCSRAQPVLGVEPLKRGRELDEPAGQMTQQPYVCMPTRGATHPHSCAVALARRPASGVYVYRRLDLGESAGGCARRGPRAWAVARGRRSDGSLDWTLEATYGGRVAAVCGCGGRSSHPDLLRQGSQRQRSRGQWRRTGGTGGREPLRTRPRITLSIIACYIFHFLF